MKRPDSSFGTPFAIWLVLPLLALFIALPLLLKQGMNFRVCLGNGCAVTVAAYLISVRLLVMLKA